MRSIPLALVCVMALAPAARAQDGPDAAYRQWQAAYDAADARVGGSGTLRDALSEAARARFRMQELAASCQSRISDLESAVSRLKFLQADYESAQRDADRFNAAKDQRFEEMMARAQSEFDLREADLVVREQAFQTSMSAHDAENARLDAWDARQDAWRLEVDAWFARVDAMSKEEGPAYDAYLAAFYEYKAEEGRFNADVELYNQAVQDWNARNDQLVADSLALAEDATASEDGWLAQVAEIMDFMVEEGKPVLEAQERASQKERDCAAAAEKLAELEQVQAEELAELDSLLAASHALLSVVDEALSAPPPSAAVLPAAEPYRVRSEDSAQAVAVTVAPPTGAVGTSAGPAGAAPSNAVAPQSRILVLPPAESLDNPAAAGAERLRTQLQAEALQTQYVAVTVVPTASVAALEAALPADALPAPPQEQVDAAPAAAFLGAAPLSYAGVYDDGSAAVVIDDETLELFFDPGIFVTDQEYQRARASQERCAVLLPKLEAEIARLRQQRSQIAGYSAEFEAVRAEIATGALRDALGAYSAAFKYARTSGKLAALSAEQSEQIERAFDLMKLGLAPAHAGMTPKEADRRNLEFKAMEDGAAMLTGILAASSGSKEVEAVLDGAGNLMKSYCEISRYRANPAPAAKPAWEKIGARVKLDIEIAANFVPMVAVGVAIEGLGERGAEWLIARESVNSLSASLKSTDEAIIYLADQLTRRQLELDKAEATVQSYERIDPSRRRAFHVRSAQLSQ